MTAFKNRRHFALLDIDPSIAFVQAARQDFEHKFSRHHLAVDQLIERGENEPVVFITALRRFAGLLKWTSQTAPTTTVTVRSDF